MPSPLDSLEFLVIADLDAKSKDPTTTEPLFLSYLQHGTLTLGKNKTDKCAVQWGAKLKLTTTLNQGGRGFELSELTWFQNKLLTFDDRTGIVFELTGFDDQASNQLQAIPRETVREGDGTSSKRQKNEWATVKDNTLIIGSNGVCKIDPDGNVVGDANEWVAVLDANRTLTHVSWRANYERVRNALGCGGSGYVNHEAVRWSAVHRKWFMLPRRVSQGPFDPKLDEIRGSNKLVIASEDFQDVRVVEVGVATPERGFSSFHFVPHTTDSVILAIKSVELKGQQSSFVTVFDIDGHVRMEETALPGDFKYEGIAFARDWSIEASGQNKTEKTKKKTSWVITIAWLLALSSVTTAASPTPVLKPTPLAPKRCRLPPTSLSSWYYVDPRSRPFACNPSQEWAMLNAYRSGGAESVHWKYLIPGNATSTARCLFNWLYYSADGRATISTIQGHVTTLHATKPWCALPVYRRTA